MVDTTTGVVAGVSGARRHLLTGARGVFAARGYSTTSIRDIGRACGLNSATLYSHFASKADLFAAIVDPYFDAVHAAADAAATSSGTGAERLERMLEEVLAVQRTHREEFLCLARDWHNIRAVPELDRLTNRRTEGSRRWLEVIDDGIDDGSIRSDVPRGEILWAVTNALSALLDDRFEGLAEAPSRPGFDTLWRIMTEGIAGDGSRR
jgi:AcrR family transcriptional regulator